MELLRNLTSAWNNLHDEQSDEVDRIPERWLPGAVFLASLISLYLEMVMVRWHSTCFHAFAIFKNVSLLSCFLGLGIGFCLAKRRIIRLAHVLPLLAVQTFFFGLLSCTNLGGRRVNPIAEQLVMGSDHDKWSWLDAVEGNAFLVGVFALNAVMFIPLGHLTGRLMSRMPRIPSYSANLLGSLAGIGLFFALSLMWTGPEIWIGIGILLLAPFLAGGRRLVAVGAASLAVVLVTLGVMGAVKQPTYYSPYQVISLEFPLADGAALPTPSVRVNHCYYQRIVDCSPAAILVSDANQTSANYYGLPYRLNPRPGNVLVVGSGTGNDVAAAVRHGADSVTGVELDPAILSIGKRIHPERPYQNPRVRTVVNDARTYLRQSDERFDTIVYGLLDSHTNLGAMTNVRVDSFVYTVEGFREAVNRLSEDGLVVVSYTLLNANQGKKLYAMLSRAYPDVPGGVFQVPGAHDAGVTFVTGPGLARLPARVDGVQELTETYDGDFPSTELATDDWPFFYMNKKTYPFSYLVMIGLLIGVSMLLIRRNLGSTQLASASNGVFFFLGAGFMLIETKSVTELGLIFGNTWSVVAVVVVSILLMGYLANQSVARFGPMRTPYAFAALLACLALGWLASGNLSLAGAALPLAMVVAPVLLTLPLFFAGLIFSGEFARTEDVGHAMAANIFGAMLGGFLEYNSMYWGYATLYPLGMALYGLAFICWARSKKEAAMLNMPASDGRLVQAA